MPLDQKRRSQPVRAAGFEDRNVNRPAGRLDSTPARALSVEEFLAHWDDVRPAGPDSWTAKAHAEQRTGSVSITRLPDGKWLIHDFAGTPTATLLAERGLSLSDLFPARLPDQRMTLVDRQAMSERTRLARWRAAWNAVLTETAIVEVAARELASGHVLDAGDVERVGLAADRIAAARVEIAEVEQFADADHLGPRPGQFFRDLGADHLTLPIMRKEASR